MILVTVVLNFNAFAQSCQSLQSDIYSTCQPKPLPFLQDMMAIKRSQPAIQACIAGESGALGTAGIGVEGHGLATEGEFQGVEGATGAMGQTNNGAMSAFSQCVSSLPADVGDTPACMSAVGKLRSYCQSMMADGVNTGMQTNQTEGASGEYTQPDNGSPANESAPTEAAQGYTPEERYEAATDWNEKLEYRETIPPSEIQQKNQWDSLPESIQEELEVKAEGIPGMS